MKSTDDTSIQKKDYVSGLVVIVSITFIFFFPIFQGKSFNSVARHMLVQYPWIATVKQTNDIVNTGYYQTDAAETYYPYFGFLTQTIQNGEFPLWVPGIFAGQPLEIILGGVYYLPRLLLMPFFSTARQMDILLVFHLLMAGISMFFLLYTWKAGFFGSLFGAVVWEFSGHQSTWLLFPAPVAATAWLPITLLGSTMALQRKSWLWAVICGAALGMIVNAGDLHFPFVNGLLLTGWYILLIMFRVREKGWSAWIRTLREWMVYPVTSLIAALLIGMPSWLPLMLAFPQLHRAPYSLDAQLAGLAYVFPSKEAVLRALFYPRNYAQSVGLPSSIFVGLPALLMIPFAFIRKSHQVIFFTLTGLVSFMILLGFRPVIQLFQSTVPLFAVFHLHRAWTYLFVISMTILAAFGFRELIHQSEKRSGNTTLVRGLEVSVLALETFLLISVMRSVTPLQPEKAEWLFPETPLIHKLQTSLGEFRMLPVYDLQKEWTPPMFAGNSSMLFGLQSGGGYQSLLPYDSIFLWKTVQLGGKTATFADLPSGSYRPYYFHNQIPLRLLENLSIGYLITPPGVTPLDPHGTDLYAAGKLELIYKGQDGWIYKDNRSLPRAFLVPQVEVISDRQSALKRLADPAFDARNSAIVAFPLPAKISGLLSTHNASSGKSFGTAEIVAERTNRISIQTQSEAAAILVLNDTWWPGWHVYVDGEEQSLLKVNVAFRGVFVSQGAHHVDFIYRPVHALVSLGFSILSSGLIILLMLRAGMQYHIRDRLHPSL